MQINLSLAKQKVCRGTTSTSHKPPVKTIFINQDKQPNESIISELELKPWTCLSIDNFEYKEDIILLF